MSIPGLRDGDLGGQGQVNRDLSRNKYLHKDVADRKHCRVERFSTGFSIFPWKVMPCVVRRIRFCFVGKKSRMWIMFTTSAAQTPLQLESCMREKGGSVFTLHSVPMKSVHVCDTRQYITYCESPPYYS